MPEETQKEYQPLDKHNQEHPPAPIFPKRGDGPDFLGRLRGKHVRIYQNDGSCLEGTLLKYNRYELLFQEDQSEDEEDVYPILLMKHFIAAIVPLEGNPFEKKPEEVKPEPGKEASG